MNANQPNQKTENTHDPLQKSENHQAKTNLPDQNPPDAQNTTLHQNHKKPLLTKTTSKRKIKNLLYASRNFLPKEIETTGAVLSLMVVLKTFILNFFKN